MLKPNSSSVLITMYCAGLSRGLVGRVAANVVKPANVEERHQVRPDNCTQQDRRNNYGTFVRPDI